ncbi:MAG TPA: NADH-quinone oxidoreductase subunit C [Candidatus Eisenbacteria bacterium]
MTAATTRPLRNRWTVPWGEVPVAPIAAFRERVVEGVRGGARICHFFGVPEAGEETRLVAVLADDGAGRLDALSTIVTRGFPSLTPDCPSAHAFERELAEQCGVVPEGHPWPKPLRRHAPDHLPPGRRAAACDRDGYPFARVLGDQVHEVAVGPVHAGVIEPGHFRFQTHGEDVLFLEIMLGYQHRGVERLLETLPIERAVLVAESIAGDSVVGHAEAFCGAIEALGRVQKGARAQSVRAIALEVERLANHLGDLGALSGDIAFAPAAAYFGRMRGDCLNLLLELSGNRFGRGLVRPGGIGFDFTPAIADRFRLCLDGLSRDVREIGDLFFENESVRARLEGVGAIPRVACEEYGFVGPTARACAVPRDVRQDHPYGAFRFTQIPVATAWAGDVAARALVRRLEVERSLEFLREHLENLPQGRALEPAPPLRPEEFVVALTEGWRGEIGHAVLTDAAGRIRRYKVKDPSFHNWSALALAMRGNQISDFPICNKSFNLSYAGHDL